MEEVIVPTEIELVWYSSKDILADLVRDLFDEKVVDNPELLKGLFGGGHLGELVFKLGHAGRGYEEFPQLITLKDLEDSEFDADYALKTTIKASNLLQQLATIIEDFLRTESKRQHQRHIDLMRTLADYSVEDKVRLVLEPYLEQGNPYELESFSFY